MTVSRSPWRLSKQPSDGCGNDEAVNMTSFPFPCYPQWFSMTSNCLLFRPKPTLWYQLKLHQNCRLLHSPCLLAVGLSVEYELMSWHVWLASLNIDWGCPQVQCILGMLLCIMGSWNWRESSMFQRPLTVPPETIDSPFACCWGCARRLWKSLPEMRPSEISDTALHDSALWTLDLFV